MQTHALPILDSNLASFTVLGASTVTNVQTSTISGNVGVWSSGGANAITGFNSSPGVATSDPQVTDGSVHAGTALAESAQGELTAAINLLDSLGNGTLLGADLVGLTLMPGVYTVPAGTTNLSGALTLDGGGTISVAALPFASAHGTPPTNDVPTPATALLFGLGLAGLAGVRRTSRHFHPGQ